MPEDPPVLKAQGFEGPDLGFFACRDPVHGGYHGQDRNRQEEHRQDGSHRDAFLPLPTGLRPGNGFTFIQDQAGGSQRLVRFCHKLCLGQGRLHINLVIQRGAQECPVKRRDGIFQHHRRDIGIPVGGIIRHHLVFIRHTDQVFAGFDQALDRARNGKGIVAESHAVSHMDAVGGGIGIRKPDALRVRIAVGFAFHQENPGNIHVGADGEGDRVGIVLDRGVDRQVTGGVLNTVDGEHLLQIGLGKPGFGKNPEICKSRRIVHFPGTDIEGIPLDIEAQENARAQGNHNHHGDELGLVMPEGTEQFFQQHHQSTSSTAMG